MRYTLIVAVSIAILLSSCVTEDPAAELPPLIDTTPTVQSPLVTNTNATEAVTTITFAEQSHDRTTYQPLIDAFMAANPDIHVQFVASDSILQNEDISYAQALAQLVQAGDVTHVGLSTKYFTSNAPDARLFSNIKPFIDADPSFATTDFYSNTLEALTFNNSIYLVPRVRYVGVLAYNKQLWQQRGLHAPEPATWTWPAMLQAMQQLASTYADDHAVSGYVDSTFIDTLAFEVDNASVVTPTTSLEQLLHRSDMLTAMRHITQLQQSHALYFAPPNAYGSADDTVVRQRVGAQRIGIWDPIYTPYDPPPTFDVGLLPVPLPQTRASFDGYVMSAGTQHAEAAWRFMRFLSDNEPPSIDEFQPFAIPARTSFAERIGYWQHLDAEGTATINAILAQPSAATRIIDVLSAPDLDTLAGMMRAVVSDKQSPEQALAAAQAALEQRLAAATATPAVTPAPFVVNTPIPAPAPAATSVRFAAVGLDAATLQPLTQQFQQQHPELAVQLVDARAGGLTFSNVAQQSDCFSYFQPPPPGAASAVADLQPRLDADASFPRGDYPPGALAPLQQDGRLLGVPLAISLPALHANPAVFAAAGLPLPTASSTWSDLQATAQQLTSGRGAQQTLGFGMLGDLGAGARLLLRAQGVALTTGDPPHPAFTSSAVQAALPPLLDLLRPSIPVSATLDALVAQGQVALWLDTRPTAPITTSADVDTLVPLPLPATGRVPLDITSALFISAHSQQPDACWIWLRFLSDQPLPLAGDYPARMSQAQADTFTQHAQAGAADVYAAYLPALQQPVSTQDATLDVLSDDPLAARWFDRALVQALAGRDLTRALDAAQATTEAYLTCVQNGGAGNACARQAEPSYVKRQAYGRAKLDLLRARLLAS